MGMRIFVDADSCPVKDEVYRVARRYELEVRVVSATWLRLPADPLITLEVVRETGDLDAADDRIVEQVEAGDVVISDDILLAARCLEKGAHPLTPRGRVHARLDRGSRGDPGVDGGAARDGSRNRRTIALHEIGSVAVPPAARPDRESGATQEELGRLGPGALHLVRQAVPVTR